MTRRYARDARGRFASTGKTAIGSRLTSKGGKRGERKVSAPASAGGKNAGAIKGRVKRDPGATGRISKSAEAVKSVKVSPEQRAIATEYKKRVQSANVRAARAMQREAAKQLGYGTDKGAIKRLTETYDRAFSYGTMMGGGKNAKPLPLRQQRGNAFTAQKSKELGFNRRFSDATWSAIKGKRMDRAFAVSDENLSGRHGRYALKALVKQSARRRRK